MTRRIRACSRSICGVFHHGIATEKGLAGNGRSQEAEKSWNSHFASSERGRGRLGVKRLSTSPCAGCTASGVQFYSPKSRNCSCRG